MPVRLRSVYSIYSICYSYNVNQLLSQRHNIGVHADIDRYLINICCVNYDEGLCDDQIIIYNIYLE